MQWTNQQQAAINIRNKNLLVAAAAGSGKTAVLVERIIQMILDDNLDVDKMLVVTFTNAAAQEMRSRIHKKIFERMSVEADSDKLLRLERQSILLSGASIMTFHAFCLSVLRRNFSKIDFDPKFREANEQELNILKQEVIEKLFEEKYSEDADFARFADNFDGTVYGDSNLHKIIFDLYNFSQSRPYPEEWLNSIVSFYENPATATLDDGQNWFDFLINFALERAKFIIEDALKNCSHAKNISAAQTVHAPNAKPKDLDTYKKNWDKIINVFNSDYKTLDNLRGIENVWDKLCETFSTAIEFISYPAVRKLPDDLLTLKGDLKVTRDKYKENVTNLRELVYMNRDEILTQIKNLAASVRQLAKITIDFEHAFTAAKRERGIIDFNDMEHLALKILNTDRATADNYRRKFQVIMVDEYQDTNGVQEEIISKIVRSKNFFAVGDVKQSIYRFRNADPEIFMQKYDNYPKTSDSKRIDLSTNFRSRLQVVDTVNAIFRRLMTKDAMEIDYNEDAELNFGADYPVAENIFDERAEFCIVNLEYENHKDSDEDDTPPEIFPDAEELDELGLEIQIIANKINAMIKAEKKIWDTDIKAYREITYKDIVILMRAVDGRATKIVDVLQKNNIPAYAADNGGYFKAPEILTTISLLSVLDNSRQDIPLASVMLSPIGGFSEEDLATLRLSDKKADLYTLIKNFSADDELSARCKNFLDRINNWRVMARQIGVPELLSKIYRETGYYDYFGTKIDGRVAQANLRMLIDRAAEFESTAFRGLSRFIQFIKKIRELENDLAAARTLGENENVVRVMTVHKSKGLEFPVVFVAQLGKSFNLQDLNVTVITHRNLGVGIYDTQSSPYGLTRVSTFARKVIGMKIKAETLAEELRILYVACTRAREKLFLTGTIKNSNALEKNLNEISTAALQGVKRPIDWLLMIRNDIEKVAPLQIIKKSKIKLGDAELKVEDKKIASPPEVAEESPLAKIPAKLSVTEVKRRIIEAEEEPARLTEISKKKFDKTKLYRRPNFMQKADISGAEYGTLMHSVIQHLNLSGTLDAKNISAQIEEMISAQILTEDQGIAVKRRVGNIVEFFASDLGRRVVSAKEIYRELPFSQKIDAGTINAGENFRNAAGEKIFVQGIIDLLFKDSATGEWVLLDYKTDRNNDDEYFQHEYKEQIRLYVQAIENLTSIKISEKYLYLLTAGRLIKMNN
ncbi:MAG: helicase-exonuclease AddAB subunit AddA [Selenomonadaceae bacterium]|nr:helicase-exonuclease AddAB subunit AddA [Selenomonadaceae bacterium]